MSVLKKIFFASVFIFVLTLLFWGIYNLSFPKKETAQKETPKEEPVETPKNTEDTAKIKVVSGEAVFSPILSADGESIKYYSVVDGKVWQIDLEGQNKRSLSEQTLSGLTGVFWSSDRQKAITQFKNSSGETNFFSYDFETKKASPLKKNLDEVAWQLGANRIFYKYYSPDSKERSLNVSDPDGQNWKKLADLTYRNVSIASVPKTSLVSFWNKPDAFISTEFSSVPIVGGDKKTILKDRFGADYLWDPFGSMVLVSHTDKKGGGKIQLGTINYNGGEYKNLDFPTFVSKCTWAKGGNSVFCALPGDVPESAVLPNEYNDKKFLTADTFWKINVETGKKDRFLEISDIKNKLDVQSPFLSLDESFLFFTNRIDGKLYRLSL